MRLDDMGKLISDITSMHEHNKFDKYITNITFPNFKNIKPMSSLNFDFPLTALVGANGSGKSSIIHALWGAPKDYSTSRFWFSTALDPIDEGGSDGINRYYYTYWENALHMHLQTVKVRGTKRNGYWEPARVRPADGMKRMPDEMQKEHAPFRTKERWNPVVRKVVYINFKCEFSAFDRYFYSDMKNSTLKEKQKKFTTNAKRLKHIIDNGLISFYSYNHERIEENRELTDDELFWVKYILGHEYTKALYVKHSLYDNNGTPSVLFSRSSINYSEAFAGSGELAIVRAVIELLKADSKSLILLDEPETSLHPQAQVNLVHMLLTLIKTKQFQIVLSTHSPVIVEALPTSAIKILEDVNDSKVAILDCRHPQMAFKRLGYKKRDDKILLAVEDQLLSEILNAAIRKLDPGERDIFDVFIPPGGAATLLSHHISSWIFEGRRIFVFLDGDQAPAQDFNWDYIRTNDIKSLETAIKELTGCKPFNPSLDKEEFYRKYLTFLKENVYYLDKACPEFVWLELLGSKSVENSDLTNQESKTAIDKYYTGKGVPTTANDLSCYFRMLLLGKTDECSSVNKFHAILSKIIRAV